MQTTGTLVDFVVNDASYAKLREISLSVDVPQRLAQRFIGGRSVTFNLAARNLATWTNYTGLDPEVSNFGNQNVARNIDVAPFPPSRSFWFSVDIGF
jgi:TonB-dependent starch-binding outer membrane protein SusC